MFRTLRAIRFLFMGPVLLLTLFVISRTLTPDPHWFRWAAFGIGIVWLVSLMRVIQAAVVLGGLAALIAYLRKQG
ncbi:MAG: hypothetical protein U0527_09175 [Candidatus Eisenbacteria bacterium]